MHFQHFQGIENKKFATLSSSSSSALNAYNFAEAKGSLTAPFWTQIQKERATEREIERVKGREIESALWPTHKDNKFPILLKPPSLKEKKTVERGTGRAYGLLL